MKPRRRFEQFIGYTIPQREQRKAKAMFALCLVAINASICYMVASHMRAQMRIALDERLKVLDEKLGRVDAVQREFNETSKREFAQVREKEAQEEKEMANVVESQNDTKANVHGLLEGSRPVEGWRVVQTVKDGELGSEVVCAEGELKMSLAGAAGLTTRTLLLSAAGIQLQDHKRTVEISERGIIIYENVAGQRLGRVLWQTKYQAPER